MEYEKVSYKKRTEVEFSDLMNDSRNFSLKALDNQEFEMPAVCH